MKKLAYVATPYRAIAIAHPEIETEIVKWKAKHIARLACLKVRAMGYIPVSPILTFADLYNEFIPDEREKALQAGEELLKRCDVFIITQVGIFTALSEGIKSEEKLANDHCLRIEELELVI